MPQTKQVTIYTDGSSLGNPGPGGYGVVLLCGAHRRELEGGFRLTTNNRMEIFAAIIGIESLQSPCCVMVYSDSKYLVNAMRNGAAHRWHANDWCLDPDKTKKAKNSDLWHRLLIACEDHDVTFMWVKGHASIEENERCDKLSVQAAGSGDLEIDETYEREHPNTHVQPRLCIAKPTDTTRSTQKITHAGQPCRKCGEPVIQRKPRRGPKPGQSYYFDYYLLCPKCRAIYMVEEAKRPL